MQTKILKNGVRIGYVLLAYASLFASGLIDNSRGPAYPSMLDDFDISMSGGSLIFALASVASLPMILTSGYWLGKFGELRSQQIFLLMITVGGLGMGFSGYIAGGYSVMLVSAVIYGLGIGGLAICTNLLVVYGSPPKIRRRLLSGLHAMYGIASILAPVIFGMVAVISHGWRLLFIGSAVVPALIFLPSLAIKQVPIEPEFSKKPVGVPLLKRIRTGLLVGLYAAGEVALTSRLVLFLVDAKGMSDVEAAPYLSAFFAFFITGRVLFSLIPVPWSTYPLMLASLVMSIVFYAVGILYYPFLLPVTGLTMSYYFPCGMDWISKRYGKNSGYMISSAICTMVVILTAMHYLFGVISDYFSVWTAMFIGPLLLIVTAILLILSRRDFTLSESNAISNRYF